MPHDDGTLAQPFDDLGVVVGDVVDAEVGDEVGVGACFGDGCRLVGPAGCDRCVAGRREQVDPRPWIKTTGLPMMTPCVAVG
jgi:hypothetical protein